MVKSVCHGQRAGSRRVQRRLVRVRRAGIWSSCRRRARAVCTGRVGSPIWVLQHPRLCASAAITVQALLASICADGKWQSAWSLSRGREFDGRVVAVIDIGGQQRHGAVGRERVMTPVGEQLGLGADEPGAANDQPELAQATSRRLRLAGVRVVADRDPVLLGDLGDQRPDLLGLLDADRELDALAGELGHQLAILKSGVGADDDRPGVSGAAHAGDQLFHEPAETRAACSPRLCGCGCAAPRRYRNGPRGSG